MRGGSHCTAPRALWQRIPELRKTVVITAAHYKKIIIEVLGMLKMAWRSRSIIYQLHC